MSDLKDINPEKMEDLQKVLYFYFMNHHPKLFIDSAHLFDWTSELHKHIQEELKKLKQARRDGYKK